MNEAICTGQLCKGQISKPWSEFPPDFTRRPPIGEHCNLCVQAASYKEKPVKTERSTPPRVVSPAPRAPAKPRVAIEVKHGAIEDTFPPVDLAEGRYKPPTQIQVGWMLVSPAHAKRWLERNVLNRHHDNDAVDSLARDILTGNWFLTHQGIAFNDRGHLIDGQHRLRAVMVTGQAIPLLVTIGLPSGKERGATTMDTVDRGRVRSVADQLNLQHGIKNARIVTGICSNIAAMCYGRRATRITVAQVLQLFSLWKPQILKVIAHRSTKKGLRVHGHLAAAAFAMAADESEAGKILDWFKAVNEGRAPKQSPIGALADFLVSEDARLLTAASDRDLPLLVLNAYLDQVDQKRTRNLHSDSAGYDNFAAQQEDRVRKVRKLFAV